jgi:hypothetical protein
MKLATTLPLVVAPSATCVMDLGDPEPAGPAKRVSFNMMTGASSGACKA